MSVQSKKAFRCLGKVRHLTRKQAKKAKSDTANSDLLNTYKCRFCGYYHVGKMGNAEYQKQRRHEALNE